MTTVYAAPRAVAPGRPAYDARTFWLAPLHQAESERIHFRHPLRLLTGAEGLERPPSDLVLEGVPGMDGAALMEINTPARPVFLPFSVAAGTQAEAWQHVRRIKALAETPSVLPSTEGTFRLMCESDQGVRQLTVAYVSGLEGVDSGIPHYDRIGLRLVAADPWVRDVDESRVDFLLEDEGDEPFLSDSDEHPWPRAVASSSLAGGTPVPVQVLSRPPVWPRVDIVGPVAPDLVVEASTGLRLVVPAGVPAGSVLTVVTDPRARSYRLNGVPAAGQIARGSRVSRPFPRGLNTISVHASGATEETRVMVSWRNGWPGLW